ncbi:conserved hypothetical protein [Burkholderia pseudomallei 305]|nr:conserved hypothetical protein [Burkholderia pseudomallei 305]
MSGDYRDVESSGLADGVTTPAFPCRHIFASVFVTARFTNQNALS